MDLNLDRTCTIRKNLKDLYTTMSLILFVILCGTLVGIDASNLNFKLIKHNYTDMEAYACVEADVSNLEELPSNAEWIDFSVSRFHRISPDTFSRFSRLKKLTFYNCDIKYIDPFSFQGLNNLKLLVIYNSNIGVIRASAFQNLANLDHLILKRNKIVYVMPKAFSGLTKVTTLNLHDNDLNCLPTDLFSDLHNLKYVSIGRNPWLCSCLENLEHFFKGKNIHMKDEERSPSYRKECMAEVKLENHFLTVNQPKPGTIIASSGDVDHVLEFLSGLSALPDNIRWINASAVSIKRIPSNSFFRFGNSLRGLEFRNCNITEIEDGAFAGLAKLKRLVLVGNHFEVIKANWFYGLVNLETLILDSNQIVNIENRSFLPLGKLRQLSLSNNKLQCLSKNELEHLVQLQRLNVTSNTWDCECQTNLNNYLMNHVKIYQINKLNCPSRPLATNEIEKSRRITKRHQIHEIYKETVRNTTAVFRNGSVTETKTGVQIIQETPRVDFDDEVLIEKDCCTSCRQVNHPRFMFAYVCNKATLDTMKEIPDSIDALEIHSSSIPTIERNLFMRFGQSLKMLKLRNCQTRIITSDAFVDLVVLETLVIQDNNLEIFNKFSVNSLPNLRYLDLTGNNIREIKDDVFELIPNLVELKISNNRMTCICVDLLDNLRDLKSMSISRNPWNCPCKLRLVQYLENRRISYESDMFQNDIGADESTCRKPNGTARPPTQGYNCDRVSREGKCSIENDVEPNQIIKYKCTYGNLNVLDQIPADAESIELDDVCIHHLPPRAFSKFHNLVKLVIRNCRLQVIEPGAFYDLVKLQELTIHNSHLKIIDSSWFQGHLYSLTKLSLTGNKITKIEDDMFPLLPNLVAFDIDNNNMTYISLDLLDSWNRLKFVRIAGNRWTCPFKIRLVQYLESRKISYETNKFQNYINASEYQCPLTTTATPPIVPTKPNFPDCKRKKDPVSNQCKTVSREGECTQVKVAEPDEVIKYKCTYGNLNVLDQIPSDAKYIELDDVCIHHLPPCAFSKFHNLVKLVIRNCDLHEIEPGAFYGLVKLQELTIHNSHLKIIDSSWFRGQLYSLTKLSLTGNKITKIEDDVFPLLPNLVTFDIDNNNMTYISLDLLDSWNRLKFVRIAGNRWTCPFTIRLVQYLESRKISYEKNQFQNYINAREYQCPLTTTATPPIVPIEPTSPDCKKTKDPVSDQCKTVSREGQCTQVKVAEPDEVIKYKCTYGNLNVLDQIPSDAKYIELDDVCIHHLPPCAFSKFHNLVKLVIRNCDLHEIEPGAFYGLVKLQELTIHNSHLKIVDSSWFQGHLYSLTKLSLTGNKITKIEDDVFPLLPNLVTFDIDNNNMTYISLDLLSSWNRLKFICIDQNPWPCPVRLELVRYLEQHGIFYEKDKFQNYNNINECQCWATTAAAAPSLPLESHFPGCNTTKEPASSHCIKVTKKGECTQVEVSEPDQVNKYTCTDGNLTVLEQIPSDAKYIELADVCIHYLPRCAFSKFYNLAKLVIRDCGLHEVDPGAFGGLFKLQELTIHNNQLKMINSSWFRDTTQLRNLTLTNNSMKEMPVDSFPDQMTSLEHLSVQGNNLTCIYTNMLTNFKSLKSMEFKDNNLKWRCHEELADYLDLCNVTYTKISDKYSSKTFVSDIFADKLTAPFSSSANVTSFLKFLAIGLIFLVQCF